MERPPASLPQTRPPPRHSPTLTRSHAHTLTRSQGSSTAHAQTPALLNPPVTDRAMVLKLRLSTGRKVPAGRSHMVLLSVVGLQSRRPFMSSPAQSSVQPRSLSDAPVSMLAHQAIHRIPRSTGVESSTVSIYCASSMYSLSRGLQEHSGCPSLNSLFFAFHHGLLPGGVEKGSQRGVIDSRSGVTRPQK